MKKKEFSCTKKPMAKLKTMIKVMGLMRTKPKVVNWPKHDPEDPKEIHLNIQTLKECDKKGKKEFKGIEVRGAKKLLEIIGTFMQGMSTNLDFYSSVQTLFYEFVNRKFGNDNSVPKYYENYLFSIKMNYKKDHRLELLAKFLGMAEENLPKSWFKNYIMLINNSGYRIQEIYNNEILKFEVPFLTLQVFLKKILTKREKEIFNTAYDTIRDYWVVKTDIQKIKSHFCLDLYQIYKYVYDKMIQTAALSVNQFFKILFKGKTEIKTENVVDFLK